MPIHPTASIHPSARIHESAIIGPNVRIGEEAEIGPDCELMDGAVIGARVRMGAANRIHFHAVVGHEPQFVGFDRSIPSGVVMGDRNEVREFVSIHRAIHAGANTVLGDANYLMANSHVAHDCVLGNNVVMANSAALAGHVTVGDRAFISGHAGIHQWVRIGRLAMVGGMSGVGKDVPPFTVHRFVNVLVGVNMIGLRRAGIGPDSRKAIYDAYKLLFRSGRALPGAVADLRAQWEGRAMPPELAEMLEFVGTKSRRGMCRGPRDHREDDAENDF